MINFGIIWRKKMINDQERKKYNNILEYNGQALADRFVLNCSSFKRNGYFLELGSREPKTTNNSYILEKEFGWKGFLVEKDRTHESSYRTIRPNSVPIIKDATQIDYKSLFKQNNFPNNLDFWQLDLEVRDNTALKTLIKINDEILGEYKFATVTMEHDIYTGFQTAVETRTKSREILQDRGYYCVFSDILDAPDVCPLHLSDRMLKYGCVDYPYEDWWVHPDLVNMEYIKHLQTKNKNKYMKINTKIGIIDCFKTYEMEY
tara:strand:+ start:868 stop:1650 length:783 start_codon:yes stop_codon:yes gene_type:complete